MPRPVLIDISDVAKHFDNSAMVLRGLSLQIERGEFVSLIGSSGCGKSTLLKLIAGLQPVSAGSLRIGGVMADRRPNATDIGYVFQEPTLMAWATVFDNVYLPLRLRDVRRRDAVAQVRAALQHVGLEAVADHYPSALSGGMMMRVSIARAMVTEPSLLLLDEPFAALDEMTRFKLNNDVFALWKHRDLTVVFVTHSVFEAVYLSNRVMIMAARPGRIVNDIALPPDRPRHAAYRSGPEHAEYCRIISRELQKSAESNEA